MVYKNRDIKYVLALCLLFIGVGCSSSKRDNPYDPANVPFIVPIQKPAYDPQKKGIELSWQYYGRPVKSYRVTRRNIRFNEIEEWEFTTPPEAIPDPLSTEHDVQPVQIFVDDKRLLAGEQYFYEVEVEDAVAKTTQLIGNVITLGSRMNEVTLDLEDHSISLKWGWIPSLEPPVKHEIYREADDGQPERIFITEDPTELGYIDQKLEGNKLYRYTVRSEMADGSVWESTPLKRAFFLKDLEWSYSFEPNTYIYFDYTGSRVVTLSAANTHGQRDYFTYNGTHSQGRVDGNIVFPQRIDPENLAFEWSEATFNGRVDGNYMYMSYIANSEAYLDAYYSVDFNAPIHWMRNPWPVSNNAYVSIDATLKVIYVIADNHLRYFIAAPDLKQAGEIKLDIASPISDFTIDVEDRLWVLLPEERHILRSSPLSIGSNQILSSQWENISLPNAAKPLAITSGQRRIFLVLDGENKQVLVYNIDGNLIFIFGGIDELDFLRNGQLMGDLKVMEHSQDYKWGEKISVMDAWRKVVQFDTVFLDELEPIF